jgi:hypothetical protein
MSKERQINQLYKTEEMNMFLRVYYSRVVWYYEKVCFSMIYW